jgi:type II secretory pathway pseudopilin PulG
VENCKIEERGDLMLKKKNAGFTLIEVIFTLTLTVLVLGITSSIFIAGNKVFSDSDVKSTLQVEGQAIQESISKIGMESVGIESISILDKNSNTSTDSLNEDTKVIDATYEDLSTKLTDINGNKGGSKNEWISISQMSMNYYEEDKDDSFSISISSKPVSIIEFKKNNNNFMFSEDKNYTLLVGGKEMSRNVKSVRIVKDSKGRFKDASSLLINIELSKKQGYADVIYPISVNVKFRNNSIK